MIISICFHLVQREVGDGGNDCGALRSAHIGLALSEAEASLVAPFSTGCKSLKCVGRLVKMGRSCLQTATASTLWFVFVAITYSPLKVYLAQEPRHAAVSEWGLIYVSIFIPFGVTALDTLCKPRQDLAPMRPTSGIWTYRSLVMLSVPLLVYLSGFIILNTMMYGQSWYIPCDVSKYVLSDATKHMWVRWGDNFDVELWVLMIMFYYPVIGYIYSFGYRFRKPVFMNVPLTLFFIFSIFLAFYLLWGGPSWLHCVFRINCDTVTSVSSHPLFFTQFSVAAVGGCMYGPQLCIESRNRIGFVTPEKANQCFSSSEPGFQLSHTYGMDSEVSGCVGPNNCFPRSWKVTVTIAFLLMALLSALGHFFLMRRHLGVKTHFARV